MGQGSQIELKLDGGALPALVESLLEAGATTRLEVSGRSTLPLVRTGDTIRLQRSRAREPKVGMVVALLCGPDRKLVVHRVVKCHGDSFVVRGDNTASSDGTFTSVEVLGVVQSVERNGHPVWFGAGRLGRLVALAVRIGLIWRLNRMCYGAYRRAMGSLKFLLHTTTLRGTKGDDGNE